MSPRAAAIIPAGGIGRRMGLTLPKQFSPLAGVPLLVHTLRCFENTPAIVEVVLVVPEEYRNQAAEMIVAYRLTKVTRIVPGGRERQDSVQAGLMALSTEIEFAVVHDAARPFITPALIERCLIAAVEAGAAMAAIPVKDTIKRVSDAGRIENTVDRQRLWQAQTPQVIRVDLLRRAFAVAAETDFIGTDEAGLLEHLGLPMTVVMGSERNIKITTPEDLLLAEALLMKDERDRESLVGGMRIGHGYDAHRLVVGRPLVLGGLLIPHDTGLLGHSDADVLTHALCDALLGALAKGDLGKHFPDSDPRYAGVSSLVLLEQVMALAAESRYALVNVDVTVVAQKPKLAPHILAIREKLARVCRVDLEAISIKATTTEGMGFTGREEGISAHAVVLLAKLARI
ncbi:MAG: hypothetical protein A2511_08360 [Deltaproteobacteria bacterium RIFOXYD12_FULL_50_9]|nr:MAG: hypothetical protein A2511_08360 [Deltaproteobacteria bacterium RIFOXYD12_FULL_50_9]